MNDQVQHAVIVTGIFVMGMLIPVRSVFMDRCGTTINRSVQFEPNVQQLHPFAGIGPAVPDDAERRPPDAGVELPAPDQSDQFFDFACGRCHNAGLH